jgi:hypothetical protein
MAVFHEGRILQSWKKRHRPFVGFAGRGPSTAPVSILSIRLFKSSAARMTWSNATSQIPNLLSLPILRRAERAHMSERMK